MSLLIGNIIFDLSLLFVLVIIFRQKKYRRNVFVCISFLLIFFLKTFVNPNSVPDLKVYIYIYDLVGGFTFKNILIGKADVESEYGYALLCKICHSLSDNFQFLLGAVSLIWCYSYAMFFKRYSPYYAIPILLLLVTEFPQSLFVLRQHLAIAILLFTYPYIINRDFKKFCIVCLCAFLMHKTAVLFFPIYFLYGLKSTKSFIFVTLLTACLCIILFNNLGQLNNNFGLAYDNYITGTKSGFSNLTDFFMRLGYLLSYAFVLKGKVLNAGINRLITVILTFSVILSFFGTSFSLTGRLVRYFTPAAMIMVPIVMKNIRSKYISCLYFIMIFALNFISIFMGSMSEWIKNYDVLI